MALSLIEGAALGAALQVALEKGLKQLGGVSDPIISGKTWGEKLEETVSFLRPIIDEYIETSSYPDLSDLSARRSEQFKDFQALLQSARDLVRESDQIHSLDIKGMYVYGNKILEFNDEIKDFIAIQGPPNLALDLQKVIAEVRNLGRRFERMERLILQTINPTQLSQTPIDRLRGATAVQQSDSFKSQVPAMPNEVVGLYNPVNDVKQILMKREVSIIGITGMGGSGKTTLASALCHDPGVQATFQNNIHFITVSQLHRNENGLLEILDTLGDRVIGSDRPRFRSIEDARNQLQNKINRIAESTHQPTLVVLDDVWSKSNLETLLFTAEGYKTIITTRYNSTIPDINGTQLYSMPELKEADALSLFCFWAFSQTSIPATLKEDLVRQVAEGCKGLPLALKVIGSSLHCKRRPVWEFYKDKLSRSEPISKDHKDVLLSRLETSIDILSDKEKQCFLDLGAFPKGRKFSVDSLLDIWVYVHGMEWPEAFEVLLEFASRNLINLTGYPGSAAIDYSCASELAFSQHDVMRDLAFHLSSQNSDIHCKRLFMPRKEAKIPTKWQSTLKDQSSSARFVSIHTGAMEERDWCQTDFPQVEVLTLFFSASHYCLPTFLQSMTKLKVFIIYNYSSKRAIISGLPCFPSPVQVRSVLLHKLIVPPPLYKNCRSWAKLEKLSVCLCEGLGNITLLDKELEALDLPNLLEINFDHCSDLKELPVKLCKSTSLERLSVTNCHLIENLPDDLGSLSSLRVLRLSACPSLSRLPPSICKLGQLEYVDISMCRSLKVLPAEFYWLSSLETLDMRECSGLKKLPIVKLRSLKHVIISDSDKESQEVWLSIKESGIHNLIIDVVAELFSLDWLYD